MMKHLTKSMINPLIISRQLSIRAQVVKIPKNLVCESKNDITSYDVLLSKEQMEKINNENVENRLSKHYYDEIIKKIYDVNKQLLLIEIILINNFVVILLLQ